MMPSLCLLFMTPLFLFGFQSILETKGVNDPTLSFSLYKTIIILDLAVKLVLVLFVQNLDAYVLISLFVSIGFVILFHIRLSLYVPKISLRNNRKYPQETNYILCAIKVLIWSCFSVFLNIVLLLSMCPFEDILLVHMMCVIGAFLTILTMIIAAKALIRLEKLKYPSKRSLDGLSKNNSPIVLLRSFKIDANPTIGGKVFDETICENLDLRKTPIISLANPDEILPSGGSLKIQAKDEEWTKVVKELLKNCRAVILVEGLSDGLHWEISKLKEYLNPLQLFVLIPSNKFRELAWCYTDEAGTGMFSIIRNMSRIANAWLFMGKKTIKKILNVVWADFSEKLRLYGINIPKTFPGDNVLMCFDENWNCLDSKQIKETGVMLDFVIKQTNVFNKTNFDYTMLGKKIEQYEANGFLNEKDVVPFKRLVGKFNKIGRLVALVCIVLFISYAVNYIWYSK